MRPRPACRCRDAAATKNCGAAAPCAGGRLKKGSAAPHGRPRKNISLRSTFWGRESVAKRDPPTWPSPVRARRPPTCPSAVHTRSWSGDGGQPLGTSCDLAEQRRAAKACRTRPEHATAMPGVRPNLRQLVRRSIRRAGRRGPQQIAGRADFLTPERSHFWGRLAAPKVEPPYTF